VHIFGGGILEEALGRMGEHNPVTSKSVGQCDEEISCTTSDDDCPSPRSGGKSPASANTNRLATANGPANYNGVAERQRGATANGSATGVAKRQQMQTKCDSDSCSPCSGGAKVRKRKLVVAEDTGSEASFSTSESGSLRLTSDHGSSKTPRPPARRRAYKSRKRCGAAKQSIALGAIFANEQAKICYSSALHFLGVSNQRVRRVLLGQPDGRRRGHRLPNSHPVFAPKWSNSVAFLHHMWTFWAEGLPDRFHMDKSDGFVRGLKLGAGSAAPVVPITAADSSDEEHERAVSGVALHIVAGEQAGSEASEQKLLKISKHLEKQSKNY